METGKVTISRAAHQADFPAQFQLVAALNPSPTGHYNDGRATRDQVLRYLAKISGPLLDRIELQVEVANLNPSQLMNCTPSETSLQVQKRVVAARELMLTRSGKPNALLNNKEVSHYCVLTTKDQEYLGFLIDKLNLSARAYHKILKVARTIADLSRSETINRAHLAEAISYRAMDTLLQHLSKQ